VSRAEPDGARAPTLGGAFRSAASDFYYHSIRLVAANALWGAGFLILMLASVRSPALFLAAALLGLPTLALFRLAGLIARGESVRFSDGIEEARRRALPAVGSALLIAFVSLVLGVNVLLGVLNPGPLGWTLMTLAGWGLFVLWTFGLAFWALLADPDRRLAPRGAARLATLLIVAHPVRLGVFGGAAALVAIVSTILIMPIMTITVAFLALVACHFVLPAADRLEAALQARPAGA